MRNLVMSLQTDLIARGRILQNIMVEPPYFKGPAFHQIESNSSATGLNIFEIVPNSLYVQLNSCNTKSPFLTGYNSVLIYM